MVATAGTPEKSQFEDALARLPIASAFKRFIVPNDLSRIYSAGSAAGSPNEFVSGMLRKVGVQIQVTDTDLERVPKTGPVVVVANHPYGILDGLMLFETLARVRPDVKIMANSLLSQFPEMDTRLILVDPFDTPASKGANRRGVRETLSFLGEGGCLIVFPAGEVSHVQLRERRIVDPDWNANIARFIRKSKAMAVPVYIKGSNSLTFQVAGMIHAQLRTARLLHELMNKREKTIELRIGNSIAPDTWESIERAEECTRYLRYRTYLLENRGKKVIGDGVHLWRGTASHRPRNPVAPVGPNGDMEAELANLTRLASSGNLDVLIARAEEAPNVLREIGRLRELTFRSVGEGTGNALDLDRFDHHYRHVFLWDRMERRIAGAYRLGMTSEIVPKFGVAGLYTSTLFRFDPRFFERIGPAIEIGRSFVCAEYQRQYGPLLLLWRGIGQFVARNPESPILFGPVTISNAYHPVSRRVIVQYLQAQESIQSLAELVKPHHKFRMHRRGADNETISRMLRDIEELSAVTADIELDGKGIPVLLKQYLKLGGKLLGFNVDSMFSDALDGLILVDLRNTEPSVLLRYLGREGSAHFMSYHRSAAAAPNLLQPV
jgi:putative hemolysin